MLIDANVFKGYYQIEIGKSHVLCGCPKQLFETTSSDNPVYYDNSGIVEFEWRNVVDYEWFEAWLSGRLQEGSIQFIEAAKNIALEKRLLGCGFPNGRDIVYVRLGLAVTTKKGECSFYTEDMDFYDPTLKNCTSTKRLKMLKSSSGPVAKILAKHGVNVACVP